MRLLLLSIGLLVLLPWLGIRDHWESAEGRGPLIAHDILATGRVAPPYLLGEPYWNKPPLFHLLVAGTIRLLGTDAEWAVRLPSVAGALLCILAAAGLGRVLGDTWTGFWSGLFVLGGLRFFTQARSCELETLLTATATISVLALASEISGRWGWTRAFLVALAASAAGALIKGPVVAPLVPVIAVVVVAGMRRSPRPLVSGTFLGVLAGTVAAALAYYGPAWMDPATREALADRASFGNVEHGRPFYYYIWQYPVCMMPAGLVFMRIRPAWASAPPLARQLALASIAGVLVFSLSKSKQSHYLLPLIPLLGPLAGHAAAAIRDRALLRSLAAAALLLLLAVDIVRGVRGNPEQSAKAAMEEFEGVTKGNPLGLLTGEASTLVYLDRRDAVPVPGGADGARDWLARSPHGLILLEVEPDAPLPPPLDSIAVAASWTSPSRKDGWVLLGPGLAPPKNR